MRQKLAVNFETLKLNVSDGKVRSAGDLEKALEKQMQEKEGELNRVLGDIERVRSYGDVAVQPKDLTRDLADVKDFIRRVVNDDHPSKANPHEDLNELSALVPKELERVLNKRDRLEQELASLQSL